MPDWFINAVATGGPAVSLIMSYMWYRAEKRAEKYETLWVKANEQLPDKIMNFTTEQGKTLDKLTKAIWANIRKLGGPYRQPPSGSLAPPLED